MRVRTAKQRAQRIDLNYFKHPHGLKRWRILLSLALPLAALLWISVYAAGGSRAPYSAGPVSRAHAFAENRCEVCHSRTIPARDTHPAATSFRAHTTDAACLSCHDAPAHVVMARLQPPSAPTPPCSSCHQEHRGRVQLARTADGFCRGCHATAASSDATSPAHGVVAVGGTMGEGHPEFGVVRTHATDPGGLFFNHAVHVKPGGVRGPSGMERLECGQCHRPEIERTIGRRTIKTGLMAAVSYKTDCARCHPLFFDERIDLVAPHDTQAAVRDFVRTALTNYITRNPGDLQKPDAAFRRVPLNFPRPAEPPARTPQEWVVRRQAADERILWKKTCAECHAPTQAQIYPMRDWIGVPRYAASDVTAQWMPRASFNHAPHMMVRCQGCHAAEASTRTADVLMPSQAVCATCHAPGTGKAESRCFECHQYHDWSKSHPVTPPYSVTDFK